MNDRSPQCVVTELLAYRADRAPDKVALRMQREVLTYRDLERQSNQLAHKLQRMGVGRDFLVGICLRRSPSFVVAALGVLKAGGAYLPLDVQYPVVGIRELLNEEKVHLLLAEDEIASRVSRTGLKTIRWRAERKMLARFPSTRLPNHPRPEDLAYIVYTSGSSGKPKGVEVTHSNLSHLIRWHCQDFSVTATDQASQLAGLGFDAAVWEIWPNLAAGATLHFAPEGVRTDPQQLQDWLLENHITLSFVPTPLAEFLIRFPWPFHTSLRLLLTGGDVLHHYPYFGLPFRCINNYGPTECTVVSTSGEVGPAKESAGLPPIGRAVAHAPVYILDEHLRKVSPGQVGEIYIAGPGVARGYRLRPELTSQYFVPNPFAVGSSFESGSSEQSARMYRTGDLGRFLPDGQIEFLGRVDDQVKILGYRIEPNQIARVIGQHPAVDEAIVVGLRETARNRLAAYVIPKPRATPSEQELRQWIGAHLPPYMMPSVFVRVESLPLTAHGKIDRERLPNPSPANQFRRFSSDESADHVPPQVLSPVEEGLARILRALFAVDELELNDNFFMLGGHSLMGAELIALIRDEFDVELSLKAVFDAPSLAQLATEIERRMAAKARAATEPQARPQGATAAEHPSPVV